MITVLSNSGGTHFSSSVPDLSFTISGHKATVDITVDGTSIYNETLVPTGGNITVADIQDMLAIHAERKLVADYMIGITEYITTDGRNEANVWYVKGKVLYCNADLGVEAQEFYDNHYLSVLMGDKVTAIGRLEYLHYYGDDACTCEAEYTDGSKVLFDIEASGGNGKYTQVDVSPGNFAQDGKTLARYTVKAGSRVQVFVIDHTKPDCAPILLFDNSFGVQELIYCTGAHKVSPKYTRKQERFGGMLRTYAIEEERTFKADTGVLTTAMANWADELFRSREIYVVNIYDGEPQVGKEVVITDCKSENSNEDDYMPRFTFDYQYSQRNHNVLDLKREGRIFDNTFDNTFN